MRRLPIFVLLNVLAGCTPAALAGFFGLATAAAPVVGGALGIYAAAARDAQQQAGLPASDPEVVALRAALAALAAADANVNKASQPVECKDPVPVGAPLPPPAVDTAALDAALVERINKVVDARLALQNVRARKRAKNTSVADAGAADAAEE